MLRRLSKVARHIGCREIEVRRVVHWLDGRTGVPVLEIEELHLGCNVERVAGRVGSIEIPPEDLAWVASKGISIECLDVAEDQRRWFVVLGPG